MELIQQVVRLEFAKQIKALNGNQESRWGWKLSSPSKIHTAFKGMGTDVELKQPMLKPSRIPYNKWWDVEYIAAHTATELGEILPPFTYSYYELDEMGEKIWISGLFEEKIDQVTADSEANSRAKLYIYLLENYLMKGGKYYV